MLIDHSFPPIYNKEDEILILGSFPSSTSRKLNFYYMHKRNRFWLLLSMIYNEDFTTLDIDEKKALLKKHHIALYDVAIKCMIKNSDDQTIKEAVPCDLKAILLQTNIKRIYLNGNKAYDLFLKFFQNDDFINSYIIDKLPSTSAANASYSLTKLYQIWSKIKE